MLTVKALSGDNALTLDNIVEGAQVIRYHSCSFQDYIEYRIHA